MKNADVPAVTKLMSKYLESNFKLAPCMTEDEVRHWMVMQEEVIYSYVIENDKGEVTDLLSFYTLPSTIIGNDQYQELRAAYMFYTVPNNHAIADLLQNALILAASTGHDVFNALDILENGHDTLLKDLKFGIGDGKLRYYLFNWRCKEMQSEDVGLVML